VRVKETMARIRVRLTTPLSPDTDIADHPLVEIDETTSPSSDLAALSSTAKSFRNLTSHRLFGEVQLSSAKDVVGAAKVFKAGGKGKGKKRQDEDEVDEVGSSLAATEELSIRCVLGFTLTLELELISRVVTASKASTPLPPNQRSSRPSKLFST
jgi:hypothetical protein